jgi:uncharacterized RDD family membrane protein YckC
MEWGMPCSPRVNVVGSRLCAFLVDSFFVWFVLTVFARALTPLHLALGVAGSPNSPWLTISARKPPMPDWPFLFPLTITYFILLEAFLGTTVGKAVFGLRVVDRSGNRAGPVAVIVRNLTRPFEVLNAAVCLGAIVMLCSRRRQRIGDHLAKTLVASVGSVPDARRSPAAFRRNLWFLLESLSLLVVTLAVYAYSGEGALQVDTSGTMGHPSVYSVTAGAASLPAGAVQVVDWQLSTPRHESGWLVYSMAYRVVESQANSPMPITCHATLRFAWGDGGMGWFEGWTPYDSVSSCPGLAAQTVRLG